jgi:hypothetical protein
MNNIIKQSSYFLASIFSVAWLIYQMLIQEIPADCGDGLQHFFISQSSWSDATQFLNHWGKPGFILLSSTFAQFGYKGMIVFNILIYCLTLFFAFKIFQKLDFNPFFASFFPFLLLLADDVSVTIIGGLTEPLFNLFVVIGLYFILHKKWLYFAITVSFIPFLRSEGQLVIILALFILIINKQYKIIPILASSFVIYAIVGWILIDDFWWYFNKSPYYFGNNIYGKGTWQHYLISYKEYIGNFSLALIIIGFIGLIYLVVKQKRNEIEVNALIFSFGVFLGVLITHSYLWANGKYGSLGLTRIATQGVPAFFIVCFYYAHKILEFIPKKTQNILYILCLFYLFFELYSTKKWPLKKSIFEKQVLNAGVFLKDNKSKINKVFYHHPIIAYSCNENPLIPNSKFHFYNGKNLKKDLNTIIKKGDIVVWDSHFGPQEAQLSLEELYLLKQLKLIQEFTNISPLGETKGVSVFQHKDKNIELKTSEKLIFAKQNYVINKNEEFFNIYSIKPINQNTSTAKITFNLSSNEENYFVVFSSKNNEDYQTIQVKKGVNKCVFSIQNNENYLLYFWNNTKKNIVSTIDSLKINHVIYPKLIKK